MSLETQKILKFGDFELDSMARSLQRGGKRIVLSRRSFDVLLFLAQHPGEVISREELMRQIWPDTFVDENSLSQSISALRRALEERPGDNSYVATIPGRGYQFLAPVALSAENRQPAALLLESRTIQTSIVTERDVPRLVAGSRGRQLLWAGCALVAGGLLVLGGRAVWQRFAHTPELRKVMVADFANQTGDGSFDHTLKRALEIDLEQSPYIDLMSDREQVAILASMRRDTAAPVTAEIGREICERSNREVLVAGSISMVGQTYLLTLEADDCATGKRLTAAKATSASRERVLSALDGAANAVRKGLGESSKSREEFQVPIANATTASLDALRAYSTAVYLATQGKSETETQPFYQKAVELDPQFAMAYGAMAVNYYNLSEYHLASENFKKALELSGKVNEKEKLTIEAHYYSEGQGDVLGGIKTYEAWAAIYPHDVLPWNNLTNQYTQLGEYGPAISAGQHALSLNPGMPLTYSVLVRALKRANRFREAKEVGAKAISLGKDSYGLHGLLYEIAVIEKDADSISRETAWAEKHSQGWYYLTLEAEAAAAQGRYRQATEIFRTAVDAALADKLTETAGDILIDEAQIELAMGLTAQARQTLARIPSPDPASVDLAVLRLRLGDRQAAERYAADATSKPPTATEAVFVSLPRVRAALAMAANKPAEAAADLEPAKPYELASFQVLTEKAGALLKSGNAEAAAGAYQKILDNPGVDGTSVLYPLAQLGLARALAARGDKQASGTAYSRFLTLWKDADQNLPVLVQARAEAGVVGRQ